MVAAKCTFSNVNYADFTENYNLLIHNVHTLMIILLTLMNIIHTLFTCYNPMVYVMVIQMQLRIKSTANYAHFKEYYAHFDTHFAHFTCYNLPWHM